MKLQTLDQFTIYIVKYYEQSNGDLLAGIHILRLLFLKLCAFTIIVLTLYAVHVI